MKKQTTKLSPAAQQANDNIDALIKNVDPAQFDWATYAKKLGVALTYGLVFGALTGYILEGAAIGVLAVTGSGTAALIVWLLGLAAMIYFVANTAKTVSDYAVDRLPSDSVAAYHAAKAITTAKLSSAKTWFASLRSNEVTA